MSTDRLIRVGLGEEFPIHSLENVFTLKRGGRPPRDRCVCLSTYYSRDLKRSAIYLSPSFIDLDMTDVRTSR